MRLTPGATCLERTALEDSVDRALDRRVDDTGLQVEVLGSAHDPRSALIRLSRAGEPLAERAFSPGPPRCADFHAAIALAIAMMIKNSERQPVAVTAAAAEPPAPAAQSPAERTPLAAHTDEPARAVAPSSRTPRAEPLRIAPIEAPPGQHVGDERVASWRLQAAGVLGVQVVAPLSGGLTCDLVYARSRFALQLGVLSLFSGERALGSTDFYYRTRPLAASLTLAARLLSRPSFSLRVWLGLLAGRVRSEITDDSGQDAADSQRLRWFAGRAALELTLPVARSLSLGLSLGPLWNFRKLGVSVYDVDTKQLIADVPFKPVGALLGLGLAFERPRAASRQGFGVEGHP